VEATVTLVQAARSVSCPELGAGRRFRRGVLGYSTKRMMTTTTTMTSARIAMLRVLMATSVYLIAPAPARASGVRERSTGSSAAGRQAVRLTGAGPRSYAQLATYLASVAARARTLARFPGLAHV
jgi:hypothetical protein